MKKLFKILALTVLATLPSLAFEYWKADYNTYHLGDNLLNLGYSTFSTYAGAPLIVEFDGKNCLQLQAAEESSSEYNMILTPVIGEDWEKLAASGMLPNNFNVVVKGTIMPGSDVDLLALYGQSTNRFFYFNCNTNGDLATSPGSKMFKVNTDKLNDVSATLTYDNGSYFLTSVTVNDDTWEGSEGCGAGDAPRFLRLSTHLSGLPEGGKGAIFASVGVDFVSADSRNLFVDTFDEYEVGTELSEQPGYAFFNNFTGYTTISSNVPNFESNALVMKPQDGGAPDYVMLLSPAFDLYPRDPGTQNTVISVRFIAPSETELIALYDKNMNRFFYLHINGAAGLLSSNPAGLSFENIYTNCATPNEISFIFDPIKEKIVEATCNGETKECEITPAGTIDMPARLRLSTQLGTWQEEAIYGCVHDFIKVQAQNRSNEPMLYCSDEALIGLNQDSANFAIYNAGPPSGTVNYTITTDKDWLTVSPTSGSFNVSDTLTLSKASGLEDGYYKCNMTIDAGEAGTQIVRVVCQNNVIYFEDFNDFEPGSIAGQRGWTVDYGTALITNVYGCDGYCVTSNSGGNDNVSNYLPKPWYENLIIKLEAELYWPSGTDSKGGFLLMKESGTTEKFECYMDRYADGFGLNYIQVYNGNLSLAEDFPHAPFDTWVPIEYTIDLQTQKLLSFGLNGVITNFENVTPKNPNCNYYASTGFGFSTETSPLWTAIDNIKVSVVQREADPKPSMVEYAFGGTNSTFSALMINAGGGSFNYKSTLGADMAGVSLENPEGTVWDTMPITVKIDQSAFEPGYYRNFIITQPEGFNTITTAFAFSIGNIYYQADFQQPDFKLGPLAGQDGWVSDYASNSANIIETNGVQSLEIVMAGGWGGMMHELQVPKNSLMKVDFDFLLPNDRFDYLEEIGDTVLFLKQHNKVTPLIELRMRMAILEGVNYVYGMCDGDGFNEMPYVENVGEFMHVTYVLDLEKGNLVEYTIGDEPYYPIDAPLNYSDTSCDLLCFCVGNRMNVQLANVEVSVIPEPAFIALAFLGLLALARRR